MLESNTKCLLFVLVPSLLLVKATFLTCSSSTRPLGNFHPPQTKRILCIPSVNSIEVVRRTLFLSLCSNTLEHTSKAEVSFMPQALYATGPLCHRPAVRVCACTRLRMSVCACVLYVFPSLCKTDTCMFLILPLSLSLSLSLSLILKRPLLYRRCLS